MSELEKQQRSQYQQKRNKYIFIQRIILVALTVCLLISSLLYVKFNKDTYVYYAEEGNAIHKAYLLENDFYKETYLNGSHAYVSSLVEKMTGDFSYNLAFATDTVDFKYNYRIDAQLEILDVDSKAPVYNPTYEILPLVTESSTGNSLSIRKLVEIDFRKYDDIARSYLEEYSLKDTSSTLIVRMYVNVVGESESFASDRSGEYVTELRIPLNKTVFKPTVTTTIPAGEQKILAIDESYKTVFLTLAIVFGVLDVAAVCYLVFFIISTRDKHIDYRRRVDRVLKNYRSYIQKTTTELDLGGYKILYFQNISELLDIRDTLQKPILAHENEDQTCARFFILTDSDIAYMYEIKVEKNREEPTEEMSAEEPAEEPIEEIKAEPVPAGKPDCDLDGVEVIDVRFPETDADYKYDPDGESLRAGDIVLVPSSDNCRGMEVEREATVSAGNHRVPKESLKYSLKKIIRVVKRAMRSSLEDKNNGENND